MEQYSQQKADLTLEHTNLAQQLEAIAVFDAETGDWIIRTNDIDQAETDENAQADASEEADERQSILAELENQYNLIRHALKKFELGTYGICEISGEPIEGGRLAINPSARTCTHHMEQEYQLPLT